MQHIVNKKYLFIAVEYWVFMEKPNIELYFPKNPNLDINIKKCMIIIIFGELGM